MWEVLSERVFSQGHDHAWNFKDLDNRIFSKAVSLFGPGPREVAWVSLGV